MELMLAKKDVTELTEANKKMEVELETHQSIDTAIEYLRQSNQKVTNRCAELETQLSERDSQVAELDKALKQSENQCKLFKELNQELKLEIDRIKYSSNDMNNSILNISSLSVNQQMVFDMEHRIQRLEAENKVLKAAKTDGINA